MSFSFRCPSWRTLKSLWRAAGRKWRLRLQNNILCRNQDNWLLVLTTAWRKKKKKGAREDGKMKWEPRLCFLWSTETALTKLSSPLPFVKKRLTSVMYLAKWDLGAWVILVYLKCIGFGTWVIVSWMFERGVIKQWEVNPLAAVKRKREKGEKCEDPSSLKQKRRQWDVYV